MISKDDLFTYEIKFRDLRYNTEFMRCGEIYCKTGPDEATKTNYPGSGNIIAVWRDEIVKCDPLDVPGQVVTICIQEKMPTTKK